MHTLWLGHVDRLLTGLPTAAGPALELAALLGQTVDTDEWATSCDEAGLDFGGLAGPAVLIARLLEKRLAYPVEERDGFAFAHSMLRESLERRAGEAGRQPELHAACARALTRLASRGHASRAARHLLLAGETDPGVEWLLRSADDALRSGDFLLAGGEVSRARQVLGARTDASGERLRTRALLLSAALQQERGALDDAELSLQEALAITRRRGWNAFTAEGLLQLSRVARERVHNEASLRLLDEAAPLIAPLASAQLHGEYHRGLAFHCLATGDMEGALQHQKEAEAHYKSAGDALQAARCRMGNSMLWKQLGHFERAAELAWEAMQVYQAEGSRVAVADALHNLGEIERLRGDFAVAERHYRESLAIYQALGSADTMYAELNLGITLIEAGDRAGAEPLLRRALQTSERLGRRLIIPGCYLFLLPCLAERGDWPAWDLHFELAEAMLAELGIVEIDFARGWEMAARDAEAAGHWTAAARGWRIAASQWAGMGRDVDATHALSRAALVDGGRPPGGQEPGRREP